MLLMTVLVILINRDLFFTPIVEVNDFVGECPTNPGS